MDEPVSAPEWFSVETSTFGDRVAGARETIGLSQADLARRLGVKVKTVQGWENDLSEPRANKLQMLAGILNVSITWLLAAEGDGLDGPSENGDLPADLPALLIELRTLRSEMTENADRLGRAEKRLRQLFKDPAAT